MERAASVDALVAAAARRWGTRTALVDGEVELSFAELDARVSRLAGALHDLGIGAGDRLTLCLPNGWRWVVAYYATLRAGAVVNPVNAMMTAAEVAHIARHCDAAAIITTKEKIGELSGSPGAPRLLILVGESAGTLDFDTLLAADAASPPARTEAPGLCAIVYTSGTTGRPKGAMLSHRAVLSNAVMTATMHGRSARDRVLTALPLPHVYGNVVLNAAMLCGMTLFLHERFSPRAVLDDIASRRITLFEGVPTMYHYLLAEPERDDPDLSSLTRCTVGGQSMPPARMAEIERRFGCPLIELWGMTELAGLGTTHAYLAKVSHGSIGVSLPGVQLRIDEGALAGSETDRSGAGELMVRGPIVMDGYYDDPVATANAIDADGWLRTGDIASIDDEGYVSIVDRKKDMILTAGYNVYPAEIERVISEHSAVSMVAVGALADAVKGEIAKAYVVLKDGSFADERSIIEHCRRSLAPYKVPRAVQFVADLPKTSTGKITRNALAVFERSDV